jgi:type IV secretory pathway VirB3-like protein
MILELFLKKLKELESQLIMLIKLKVNVLNLTVGLIFVLIVKTDIKIIILLSLYMTQRLLKKNDANLINSRKGINLEAEEMNMITICT